MSFIPSMVAACEVIGPPSLKTTSKLPDRHVRCWASLAVGDSVEEILADFPTLNNEDIMAAIAFAAASAEEDLPVTGAPQIR